MRCISRRPLRSSVYRLCKNKVGERNSSCVHNSSRIFRTSKRSFAELSGKSANTSSTGFFAWYSKKLDTHPITTKCVSAGLISSLGNILAQGITFHQERTAEDPSDEEASSSTNNKSSTQNIWQDFRIDPAQVGRFAFLNVTFVAPVLHYWYNFINRSLPGKSIWRVMQRTFWDEFVFSPLYIPVFLGGLWRMEGTDWPKIKSMIINELPGIIVCEWILWVPTMMVTFRYAPVKFQVLVINVVGVVWQTFLSFMAAHAHGADDKAKSEKVDKEASLYLESTAGPEAAHQGCGDKHPKSDQRVQATSSSSSSSSSSKSNT